MSVVLVGQNPALTLASGDSVTALASVWSVEWSLRGAGNALVLWHAGDARVLGTDESLCQWVADTFTRQFPEARELAWDATRFERADMRYEIDLERGFLAEGGDVTVEISEPLARRVFRTDDFPLDGVRYAMSNVFVPCGRASVTIAGEPVPGAPIVKADPLRPSSSAFLAVAEVWSTA